MNSSRQELYLDIARISASIAVVVLHIASFVMTHAAVTLEAWNIANIFNSFSRWSVPIFVMISGALFLTHSQPHDAKSFYLKRLSKLGLPVLWWSIFYFIWKSLAEGLPLNIGFYLQTLLFDQPFLHLYFLFVIGWLYLFTPWFGKLWLKVTLLQRVVLVTVFLALGTLWPPTRFIATFWVPFIGYFVAGGVIAQIRFSYRTVIICILMSIVCFTLVAIGTDWLTHQIQATHNLFFYDFTRSPLVIVGSLLLFISMKGVSNQYQNYLKKHERFLSSWASMTLGIYLIHPLILWVIQINAGKFIMSLPAIISISTTAVSVYVLSLALTWLLKRIPYLRRTV